MSAASAVAIEPFFLNGARGRLFALEVAPAHGHAVEFGVLLCAPFAEELNRTRRAVQLAARRIASCGASVLLLDLYGTGDSEGEFDQARWEIWREDLVRAAQWLRARSAARVALWGVRLGAGLALELARDEPCEELLLWQPVTKGALFLRQFLRLRVAADMLADDPASSVEALRARLAAGAGVEIAGYELAPELARAIDAFDLERLAGPHLPPVHWLEAVAEPERPLAAASRALIERWQSSGVEVRARTAVAQPFWGTPEIVVPAGFLDATEQIARGWVRMAASA